MSGSFALGTARGRWSGLLRFCVSVVWQLRSGFGNQGGTDD